MRVITMTALTTYTCTSLQWRHDNVHMHVTTMTTWQRIHVVSFLWTQNSDWCYQHENLASTLVDSTSHF